MAVASLAGNAAPTAASSPGTRAPRRSRNLAIVLAVRSAGIGGLIDGTPVTDDGLSTNKRSDSKTVATSGSAGSRAMYTSTPGADRSDSTTPLPTDIDVADNASRHAVLRTRAAHGLRSASTNRTVVATTLVIDSRSVSQSVNQSVNQLDVRQQGSQTVLGEM